MQGVYVVQPTRVSCNSPVYGREVTRIQRSNTSMIVKVGSSTCDLDKRCASYGKGAKIIYQDELHRDEFSKNDVLYIEGYMIETAQKAGFKLWRTKNNPQRKEYFRIKYSELEEFMKVVKAAEEAAYCKILS